jgi:two-component system LytT family response regulator
MNDLLRVLIVEDEPHARGLLREMLTADGDVTVVAESADGASAVADIERCQPDLVLLDVQLPDMDGFEVLEQLDEDVAPIVVFVTAFDHYAIKAFEVHALDYLLKPFDAPRLEAAIARARRTLRLERSVRTDERIVQLLETVRSLRRAPASRIPLKSEGSIRFVETESIDWVEIDDHLLRLHTGGKALPVRGSLSNLEKRLDASQFVRIHRSSIVNVARISEIRTDADGEYVLVLSNGTALPVGRRFRDVVHQLIRGQERAP